MNILHINSYYSYSKFYKNLYDMQVKNGLNIDVFVPVSSSFKNVKENLGGYTKLSVNHTEFDRIFFHLKHKKIYKDIISKYDISKFSVIHAHSLFSNGYIAMKLKIKYGIPYFVAVRNTDINVFFKKMIHLRRLGINILDNADRIIFLSKSYRDILIDKYIPEKMKSSLLSKSLIIPNGVDDFWLSNKGEIKKLLTQKKLKLLYVGVVNKNKNIITMVKVVKYFSKLGIEAKLTFVGSIEDKYVYNQIKDFKFVEYIKSKPKEELLKIFREHDIFVMPSIHETFGLVYVEAMSQGLPLIYTKGQGFDGQFEDGEVGFAVECLNPDDIINKIEKIIENYYLISENCVEKCDIFSWPRINDLYEMIYKNYIS